MRLGRPPGDSSASKKDSGRVGLLRKPGGFEGLIAVQADAHSRDPSVPQEVGVEHWLCGARCAAPHPTATKPREHDHFIPRGADPLDVNLHI
jgi:hypothetical protein